MYQAIIINTILIVIYSFIVYKAMNQKNVNLIVQAENVIKIQGIVILV